MYSQSGSPSISNGLGRLTSQKPQQSSTGTTTPSQRQRQTAATCVVCRRRKVKCDRQNPCGNCTRAGKECTQFIPSRLPRGRQGGRKKLSTDGELRDRIAKLEGLMKEIEGHTMSLNPSQAHGQAGATDVSNGAQVDREKSTTDDGDQFLAASFWSTMSEEISGLKDVLEDASHDEDESGPELTPPSYASSSGLQRQPRHSGFIFFQATSTSPESITYPTGHQIHTLCDIYLTNVDPVLKLLHAPSLKRYLQEDAANLDCSPGLNGLEALKYAIYFSAIVTLADPECRNRTGEKKAVLLPRYQAATELALAKADFVNTLEISTLQALTIYLAAVRVNDNSRFMWTLVSLAVRIGQAMGLHLDETLHALQPFDREMRRRLWWQICALDSHAAEDRASSPVLTAESFNTKMPLRINDDDIRPGSLDEVKERDAFTEMTFSLICHEIFDTVRQLNYVPARDLGRSEYESQEEKWRKRIDLVVQAQRRIEKKYLQYLNLARPFHWTTRMVADLITATMWLLIYRPLQRGPDIIMPQIADPGILQLSTDVLERAHQLYTDPAASSFRWLSRTHVQWHAIAVTAAELCVKTEGPAVDRAWIILEQIFSENAKFVADSEKGMLWRPIKKLMHRARGVRRHYVASRSATNHALSVTTALNASDRGQTPHALANHRETVFDFNLHQHQHQQQTAENVDFPFCMESLQQASPTLPSAPLEWDPWLTAATTNQSQHPTNLDLTAWTNWEDFIDHFQGQDEVTNEVNAGLW